MKSSSYKRAELEQSAADALLKSIRRISPALEPVPPGWFTAEDYRAKWKLSPSQTRKMIREGVNAGLIEQRKFTILLPGDVIRAIHHYREARK